MSYSLDYIKAGTGDVPAVLLPIIVVHSNKENDNGACFLDAEIQSNILLQGAHMIYHLARMKEWESWVEDSQYKPPSLLEEGFIHCSRKDDLVETARSWFGDEDTLVVLCIVPQDITSEIRYESSPGRTALMPHIFGPVPLSAIHSMLILSRDALGNYSFQESPAL